jgi:ribosomal protein S18 acetylase RimI-like enzyme
MFSIPSNREIGRQNMTVRPLKPADAALFRKLRLFGLQESSTAFGSSYKQAEKIPLKEHAKRLNLARSEGVVVGAFEKNQLVGVGGLLRHDGIKERHKAFIWGLYVLPKFRKRGIGRAILNRLVATAISIKGLIIVKLAVESSNNPAKKLYESFGFRVIGREPKALRVDGVFFDEDFMILELERKSPDI